MKKLIRMSTWLLLALTFYLLAAMINVPSGGGWQSQAQTGLWKAGHITIGAYLGYWIDTHLFRHIDQNSGGNRILARAVVVGAAIFGMALGL